VFGDWNVLELDAAVEGSVIISSSLNISDAADDFTLGWIV